MNAADRVVASDVGPGSAALYSLCYSAAVHTPAMAIKKRAICLDTSRSGVCAAHAVAGKGVMS